MTRVYRKLQWIAVLLRSAIFLVRSKVTLEEVLQSSELEQNYGARLCPGWVRIGVRNVQEAKQWYHKYVGMSVLEEHKDQGWILMGLGVEHHPGTSLWWLETLPSNAYTGPISGPATPYCVLHDKWVFQKGTS
jgi:catechol-2,3-dioxygenase